MNTRLKLESCSFCHNSAGFRQELKLMHKTTAQFLVTQGLMPPWPFTISAKDRALLFDNH